MIPFYKYSLKEDNSHYQKKPPLQKKKMLYKKQNEKNAKKQKNQKEIKREEALRDQIGLFRNSVIERNQKIIKKNAMRQDELDGFLTGAEFDDLKNHYNDFNFADLVLQFPNPDQNPQLKVCANTPVKFSEAEDIFDNVLTVMGGDGFSKAQLKLEREAFLYSFLLLEDYDEDKHKGDLQIQTKKKTKQHKKIKKKKDKDQETQYEKYLDLLDQMEKQKDDDVVTHAMDNLLTGEALYTQLINLKLTDTAQFSGVRKAYSLGGFLEKREYKTNFDWLCKNDKPKDFCTLVRNTIMAKLTNSANLHTRQFISGSGDSIFMIVKSSEQVIQKEAESSGLAKQLELGYADLFSLEPCDKLYRPLRLKQIVRQAVLKYGFKKNQNDLEYKEQEKKNQKFLNLDEEKAEKLYLNEVSKWEEKQLWQEIALKQAEVDDWMNSLADNLKIDTSNEKTDIINDDETTTRDEWNAYFIYLCYLCNLSQKIKQLLKQGKNDQYEKELRGNTNIVEMNEGFLYRLVFRKAMGDANEVHQKTHGFFATRNLLQSIWQRIGMKDPISPFTHYFQVTNDLKENRIWRQYEINEKKYRSIFLNVEKIKLCNSVVQKQINVSRLIKKQLVMAYFPIHDCYQLKGNKKEKFFMNLKSNELMMEDKQTESEQALRKIFKSMEDEAEGADFDSDSVELETKFNPKLPWAIPEDSIRDYFGEKIAIYFLFLSFYTFHLSYIALLGFIMQIIQGVVDYEKQQTFNIIFAVIIIVWSTMFIELWKRQQVTFSLRFGQQDFEEAESERPSFDGTYIRNITNDDLNEEYYPPLYRKLKMFFSIFVSVTIITLVIICVFLIFNFKVYLLEKDYPFLQNPVFNTNTIPAMINAMQIVIFNIIYDILGDILNNFENHKILSSYENSLIGKVFMFQFFNLFNSCVFIAYLSPVFPALHFCEYSPGKEDCFLQLRTQIISIFLVNFFKNIPELLTPLIKGQVLKKLQSAQKDESQINNPFKEIDQYILNESSLAEYITTEEVDGTVADYMELVIQFSFLTLFGLSFPTSFVLAFLNNVAEIQVDKLKLMDFSRRPMPNGASNIGTWLLILDVITFCSIFSNAGLIAYTSQPIRQGNYRLIDMGDGEVVNEQDQRIVVFSSLLITFLSVKYFFRFLIPDVPEIAVILNKRHKVAVDTVVRGFQKSKSKLYKIPKVNFNIGGIVEEHQHTDQQILQGLHNKQNLQNIEESPKIQQSENNKFSNNIDIKIN